LGSVAFSPGLDHLEFAFGPFFVKIYFKLCISQAIPRSEGKEKMTKSDKNNLTYPDVIDAILKTVTGPLPVAELARRMLAELPSTARDPQAAMRNHILKARGWQLVFTTAETIIPLRLAYQGVRFRLQLTHANLDRGLLPLNDILQGYLPQNLVVEQLQFVDAAGAAIPTRIFIATEKTKSPFGIYYNENIVRAGLGTWYRAQKISARDYLVVTILDWEQGRLQLERVPAGRWSRDLLVERDRLLADLFYDVLEGAREERIYNNEAVPTVYTRLIDQPGPPPGHWMEVITADPRMTHDRWQIVYSDRRLNPLEMLLGGSRQTRRPSTVVASNEQRQRIYRLRASLAGNPKIWREIDIQGRQTLADLDRALREAFNHDCGDHMAGFWKLIPRAPQASLAASPARRRPATRIREVEIGAVDPMGGGEAAGIAIAELGLGVGDHLIYVYDFGDWVEHTLALQAVAAPQADLQYPCEVARNKPQYVYCTICHQAGRQQVAGWICRDCSQRQGAAFLLCADCARQHPMHYIHALLY